MFIDNIEELKNVKKYICGSPNLCKFLEKNGIKFVSSYKLNKEGNNRTMWVFIITPELSKLLTQWSNNKPSKNIARQGGE